MEFCNIFQENGLFSPEKEEELKAHEGIENAETEKACPADISLLDKTS
jgi:hypothetical protein